MSKASDIQSTPQKFFDGLNRIYEFGLDAAANEDNHKVNRWYGPGGEHEDALSIDWPVDSWIWCNPPYSRGMQKLFVGRAEDCAKRGGAVLMLLPADTSTKLFDSIFGRHEVQFVIGRLKFNGATNSPKFGSMLVKFVHK